MQNLNLDTLQPAFLAHCADFKSLSRNTLNAYTQDLAEFRTFTSLNRDRPVLNGELIGAYIRWLREERELGAATVRRRIACLKAFFGWTKETGATATSPFEETTIVVRLPKRLPRALTRQQVRQVADAVSRKVSIKVDIPRGSECEPGIEARRNWLHPQDQSTTTYLAVCVMLATGIRVGELTSIRLSDLDRSCSVINISGKGARERTVFLTNQTLSATLEAYSRARERCDTDHDLFLLNSRGRPLSPQALRLRLRKLGKELAFLQRLTPHRFRHTAATVLLEEGVDIRYVQRLLGHSSISTTEIYTHVTDTSLRKALERADVVSRIGI